MKDAWEPVQLWPEIVLPCDKPQVTYITVNSMRANTSQAHQTSRGPSTSSWGAGGQAPSQDKLMELLSLHKQTTKVLTELGLDPGQVDIQDSSRTEIPIPLDSNTCPVCDKVLSSHYREVLHYKYGHVHRTKWHCAICDKFFTSQSNLDEHDYNKHGDTQYSCYLCLFTSQHKRHLLKYLKVHKAFKQAQKDGLICEHCLQENGSSCPCQNLCFES